MLSFKINDGLAAVVAFLFTRHPIARTALMSATLLLTPWALAMDESSGTPVERGEYLARAGNCMSCHTRAGGQPFAGGVEFATPFGTLYSTNITPDPQTGIGGWTQQEFASAVREGLRPDGQHLYPAFPYTAFTKVSDADIAALWAYFQTLAPVRAESPENTLGFPYSQRWLLRMWKALYFDEGRFEPDPAKSNEWNRGAYLVEGLGHCGACHTPRNFLGAEVDDEALSGGSYQDALHGKLLAQSPPNLTSSPNGLAAWSQQDIANYLRLGISSRAAVYGAMNEVVLNSTRHLSEQDALAMGAYLKGLPAHTQKSGKPADQKLMQAGSLQYDIHCGTCHLPTGLGADETGPPLVGSAVTLAADPASLINVTLHGAKRPHEAPSPQWTASPWDPMGPFADKLTNEQAAAILSFIRNSWGNEAGKVTPEQVANQR